MADLGRMLSHRPMLGAQSDPLVSGNPERPDLQLSKKPCGGLRVCEKDHRTVGALAGTYSLSMGQESPPGLHTVPCISCVSPSPVASRSGERLPRREGVHHATCGREPHGTDDPTRVNPRCSTRR
jgi:hypothetical protein